MILELILTYIAVFDDDPFLELDGNNNDYRYDKADDDRQLPVDECHEVDGGQDVQHAPSHVQNTPGDQFGKAIGVRRDA